MRRSAATIGAKLQRLPVPFPVPFHRRQFPARRSASS